MDVSDLIEARTSSDDAEESKPEPDIFEAAIARIGVEASEIVVVGDSRYDAQAAVKAGATAVGVLCGGFQEHDLRENGCVEIYRDPEDLLRRFDKSVLAR
jgi:phosphoglycolate phosphatase-like HAD superfamily hydrolase